MTTGAFSLTSVANLPNVTVAFPGEHWSDRKASGAVTPGAAVFPTTGGKFKTVGASNSAAAAASPNQVAIALRCVDVPDTNAGSIYNDALGPNDIKNLDIADGGYIHRYYSGVFHLTLITPDTYVPGDLIGWDADGARPTGKSGTGAWAKNANADVDSIFEVQEFRPVNGSTTEGILTVRSLRGQF